MRGFNIVSLLVFAVVLTWTVGPLAYSGLVGAYEATQRPSYLETQGVLTESGLDEDGWWTVRYAYTVVGERYDSGIVYDAVSAFGGGPDDDAALAAAHPVGSAVTVHYDPRRPERAVLDPIIHPAESLAWLFSLGLAGFIASPWFGLIQLVLWNRRTIAVGGCEVSRGPTGATHVRMPVVPAILLALTLTTFVPFVSVFVVMIASAIMSGGKIGFGALRVRTGVGCQYRRSTLALAPAQAGRA